MVGSETLKECAREQKERRITDKEQRESLKQNEGHRGKGRGR